ncbi:MAG TPA: flagellar hook-associated protein FlgL [Tissierellaceae bacterium]
MRITSSVINQSFLKNLSKNLTRVQKYHEQLTSGKQVSRPSDNPLLVGKIMAMDTNIKQNEKHNGVIKDTLSWVETQDTSLKGATDALYRIRDLMVQGSNGTLSDDDRRAINNEVQSEIEHFVDVLNTNFDGRYIFSGTNTLQRPFEVIKEKDTNLISGIKYNGNEDNLKREIAQGVTINLVTDGGKLIKPKEENNTKNSELGNLLKNIVSKLDSGENLEDIGGKHLEEIDKFADELVRIRTQIGAIDNRLQAAEERNVQENLHLKAALSEREDVDLAEKYMEFMTMGSIYQASLSIGAKIMQPSLLDYLR